MGPKKRIKADELGISIIDEASFLSMILLSVINITFCFLLKRTQLS